MNQVCESIVVVHRPGGPDQETRHGVSRIAAPEFFECSDPTCAGDISQHAEWLPCRWSWPLAHGRKFGGRPFPETRCADCRHIRRAGMPAVDLVASHG